MSEQHERLLRRAYEALTVRQLVRDLAGNMISDDTVEHHYARLRG